MPSLSLKPTLAAGDPVTLVTRDGLRLRLRQVAACDANAVAELFDGLSPEDMRFRFLSSRHHLPPAQIAELVNVDHHHAEHLLAFDSTSELLVASLMIVASEHLPEAEVAIAVRPDYKGRGIGWTLLNHAADLARARGIRRLRSIENRANREALDVERTLGFQFREYEGDASLTLVEIELD